MTQKLLRGESETIRSKIKVYTLRSTAVNAFATSRGDVFVTLGLLSKLKTEAELAFILSHEITHVIEDHNLELLYQSERISKKSNGKTVKKNTSSDDMFLSNSMYSKELEMEADTKGFDRFINAGFDVNEIKGVFEMLKYAEHPFCEDNFDYTILEAGSYALKKKYKEFKIQKREGTDQDEDDTDATHPNLATRKDAINEKIGKFLTQATSNAKVNPTLFKEIVRLAQMEIPMLYLHKGEHGLAIYTASSLLKNNPTNLYLKKCIAKALYLDVKFENSGNHTQRKGIDKVTGAVQGVYNFMSKMKGKEANALMLNYNYRLIKEAPNDVELKLIMKDAAVEALNHAGKLVSFTRNEKDVGLYWKRALLDYKEDKLLNKIFAAANVEIEESEQKIKSKKGRKKKNGYRLGIDKIVIVNPQYLRADARHKQFDVKFISSEKGRLKISDYINLAADKNKLQTQILDVKQLGKNDIEAFNDLRFLNEWFSQQGDYTEISPTPGLNQEKINAIAKKYGTRYFLWTGIISTRVVNRNYLMIPPSIIFWPSLPFVTYSAIKPKYSLLYYSIIFDVETGRREVLGFNYFNRKDSEAMMKSHLYNTFLQIKSKPKK